MIVAGIIWANNNEKKYSEYELKNKFDHYVQSSLSIRKDRITLFVGSPPSINDKDSIIQLEDTIFVGRVFHKETCKSITKNDLEDISKQEHFNDLVNDYWGKYLVFKLCANNTVKIIRDPTGQLPLFYYSDKEGNYLFSSDIQIIFDFLGRQTHFNWAYLSSYILNGCSYSTQTPFEDINELPPGYRVTFSNKLPLLQVSWDPRLYYTKSNTRRNLVKTISGTLKAWTENYENIGLSFSGGLDSSALLYCLKEVLEPDQKLLAYNYFNSNVQMSNELKYAKKICLDLEVELIELDFADTLAMDEPSDSLVVRPNKPSPGLLSLKQEEIIRNHLAVDSSLLLISGHGGDNVYMHPPSQNSLIDYYYECGFTGLMSKFEEIASFYRKPLLNILGNNLRALLRIKENESKKLKNCTWIKKELLKLASNDVDYQQNEKFLSTLALPGKSEHIHYIKSAFPTIYLNLADYTNPIFYPFLYQPIMEHALSIPSYELYQKGFDRYPLRKAISEHFDANTVWRRDKGQTTGMFQLAVKKNIEKIKNLCSSGQFCKMGLINKDLLFRHIDEVSNGSTKSLWPLVNIISAEMFLVYWENKPLY